MTEHKRKIKILYLHNMAQISGGERSLLNLWENLDRGKFDPYLIIPQEGEFSREAKKAGIPVSCLEIPQIHPKNFFHLINIWLRLCQFLRSNKIDIIHSYSPRNNILSALAGKFLKVPVIWHERNLLYQDEPDITRKFFFLPERIICNSRAVARRFEQKKGAADKVKVILNGVNLDRYQPGQNSEALKKKFGPEGTKVVGMVTNLNKRKRVEFLLGAVPLILQKYNNVKFLIVGGEFPSADENQLRELQTLSKNLGVQNQVVFTGFQDDVRPFLAALDVFVHVTVKEACSRAIIEAMAMGKPVIAMNDGGNPELVDQNMGILVEPEDRESFVNAVVGLLRDEERCQEIGKNGRIRAEELFDVQKNARETEEVYLKLMPLR